MLLLLPAAEASRLRTDACDVADRVVIATVESLVYERGSHGGVSTVATLTVEHVIVGPSDGVVQVRYAGGRMGELTYVTSEQPRFEPGERWLLALRTSAARPRPSLHSWDEVPADVPLPDAEALHLAWDTMCAAGPVYGVSIDALRGTVGALPG